MWGKPYTWSLYSFIWSIVWMLLNLSCYPLISWPFTFHLHIYPWYFIFLKHLVILTIFSITLYYLLFYPDTLSLHDSFLWRFLASQLLSIVYLDPIFNGTFHIYKPCCGFLWHYVLTTHIQHHAILLSSLCIILAQWCEPLTSIYNNQLCCETPYYDVSFPVVHNLFLAYILSLHHNAFPYKRLYCLPMLHI